MNAMMFHAEDRFGGIQGLEIVYDWFMSGRLIGRATLLHLLLLLAQGGTANAQHDHAEGRGPQIRLGAHAIGVVTHVTPAVTGEDLTEGYLTQPALMAHASLWDEAIAIRGMLNLEGATLRRGELNPGIWGEGYVDRRHPHTYLHELVATASQDFGAFAISLSAGKGFAPFGTDDPMVRGFIKYPANHHLAQVLERLVAIAAVRYQPVTIEVGTFNGDEPLGPRSNGMRDRFGDSWAVRGTVEPLSGVELQASRAEVASPELPQGGGPDQHKTSVSVRTEQAMGAVQFYALGEYARTGQITNGQERFAFTSYLAELSGERDGWRLAVRLERTVRPEEERQVQGFPFRSVRPPTDFSILGRTRWQIATVQLSHGVTTSTTSIRPILEIERSSAETVNKPAVYEPDQFYGNDVLWTFSFGIRVTAGARHARMGRYGAAISGRDIHPSRQ